MHLSKEAVPHASSWQTRACRQFQSLDYGDSDRKRKARSVLKHVHYDMENQIASGNLLCDAGSSNLVLCDNLEGWEVGGRLKREGRDVYL